MLAAEALEKRFALHDGRIVKAMDGVGFRIEQGQLYTLLGPSGCGKTTTLRSIAGLETPDSGRIAIGDMAVFDSELRLLVPANKRKIGMVFQSYAIWPHMDVFENVAFPLRVSGEKLRGSDVAARVAKALATVRMEGFERRPATRLSGGQQQRLALARALVMEPRVLLLDEPLSNLDAKLRESMRLELRRLQKSLGITTVYVTHDQTEALAMSDVVAVMENGRIVQQGDPRTIYSKPATRFVAEFIGSSNFVPGKVVRPGADALVEIEGGSLRCAIPNGLEAGARVLVSIRPEDIALRAADGGGAAAQINRIPGRVVEQIFLGSLADHVIAAGGAEFRAWCHPAASFVPGSEVVIEVDPARCIVLPDKA